MIECEREDCMQIRKRTILALSAGVLASTLRSGLALADDKPVTVYTAQISAIVDKLIPLFEKETGLKAEVVKLGSGDVAKRAKAEAANPQADVIWSISGSALTELADILEPYQPKDIDKVNQKLVGSPAWPPYTGVVYVLAVNTSLLPLDQAPKSWA